MIYAKVSIIIPTYNAAKFLDRTTKSVLNQTYKNWELIIVDDASEDNTRKIIKNWERKDERIKGIFLDKNSGGPAHPKNVGIQRAKGELIAFLDHDDEWMPEKLEKQVIFLNESDSKCGLVTCDFFINRDGRTSEYITPVYDSHDQIPRILRGNFVHSCSSIVVKKEVFDRVGVFDEFLKTSDDWDLYLRLLLAGYYIGVISQKLFIWHCRDESAGKSIAFHGKNELEYFLNKHKKIFIGHGMYGKKLESLSLLSFFDGDFNNGRVYAKQSFKFNRRLSSLFLIFVSFLHSVWIFKFLFYLKNKMSNNVLEKNIKFADVFLSE
jgi:glycosyltransferase involved in cell wall biosynthesis